MWHCTVGSVGLWYLNLGDSVVSLLIVDMLRLI